MAVRVIPGGDHGYDATAPHDTYLLPTGERLLNDDVGVRASGLAAGHLLLDGTVVSAGAAAVLLDAETHTSSVNIGPAGSVSGRHGIAVLGDGNALVNLGVVRGLAGIDEFSFSYGAGIGVYGAGGVTVTNRGSITGNFGMVADAVTNLTLNNDGFIRGDDTGLFLSVARGSGSAVTITNNGTVSGTFVGVSVGGDETTLARIRNTGLIEIDTLNAAILGNDGGRDLVRNLGTITGDVALFGGADRFDGRGGIVLGSVRGGAGRDTLHGGDGPDRLDGNEDDDRLTGDGGRDTLFGGAGADTLAGSAENDLLDGGEGRDRMIGGGGEDVLFARAGHDRLEGRRDDDILHGGSGNDTLRGGTGGDRLFGGGGDDHLFGEGDRDLLRGGVGHDVLFGGAGDDTLVGGRGVDTFVVAPGDGHDRIADLEPGDRLDLSGYGFASAAEIVPLVHVRGTTVLLDLDGDRLVLAGAAAVFDPTDIIL